MMEYVYHVKSDTLYWSCSLKSDETTPSAFLDALPDDWRKATVLDVRALLLDAGPELEEKMHYGMLGYVFDGRFVFHLNAQRAYVSFYVGDVSKVDPDGSLLEGLNHGKGCIRVSKSRKVHETRLDAFVARAMDQLRAGGDIDC